MGEYIKKCKNNSKSVTQNQETKSKRDEQLRKLRNRSRIFDWRHLSFQNPYWRSMFDDGYRKKSRRK